MDDRGEGEYVMELHVLYGGEVAPESDVTYDGWDGRETAPELDFVLSHERITKEEFIRRHTANPRFVYFQAFAIGHSYVRNPVR